RHACHRHNAQDAHGAPPSIPTRRSSDLATPATIPPCAGKLDMSITISLPGFSPRRQPAGGGPVRGADVPDSCDHGQGDREHHERSEEYTSELQSRENLVCRRLLEKKKCS